MKRYLVLLITVTIVLTIYTTLSAQSYDLLFYQPYFDGGTAVVSSCDSLSGIDYEAADNFWGLEEDIEKLTIYGITLYNDGTGWQEQVPAVTEPFIFRFYEYEEDYVPNLLAPATGTYNLVLLSDGFLDGWAGDAPPSGDLYHTVSLYVNGELVLEDITMLVGPGPDYHPFFVNAGDEISTVFTINGQFANRCYYAIRDPNMTIIAEDGGTWNNHGLQIPTGIPPGYIMTLEPDWTMPLETIETNVEVLNTGLIWAQSYQIYRFSVEFTEPIALTEGWVSAQIDSDIGSGTWFLWINSQTGDEVAWQRISETGRDQNRLSEIPTNVSYEGNSGSSRAELAYDLAMAIWGGLLTDLPGPATNPYPLHFAQNIPINGTLSWTGHILAEGYYLYLGTMAAAPLWDILNGEDLSITTFNYSGLLDYATQYRWMVVPYNSVGEAANPSIWRFTTATDITLYPPFLVNFVGPAHTFPPADWLRMSGILAENTILEDGIEWYPYYFGNVGSTYNSAYINIRETKNHWLITPPIELSDGGYQVEFDIALTPRIGTDQTNLGPNDYVAFVISRDDGLTWSDINVLVDWDANDTIYSTGNHIVLDTTQETGRVRFGVYAERSIFGTLPNLSFFFTNFRVRTPPNIYEPIFLTLLGVEDDHAILSWTENNDPPYTAWEIKYGAPGFDPETTGITITTNVNPHTLIDLEPLTTYDWYVRTYDSSRPYSEWAGPARFSTSQVPATLPYYEDFESLPTEWLIANGTMFNKWHIGTATSYSGDQSAYISNDGGASNVYTVTSASIVHFYRDIKFTEYSYQFDLSFWWKGYGENGFDYLQVYLVDPSFTPVAGAVLTTGQIGTTYNLQANWAQANITLPGTLSGQTKRLVYTWRNDNAVGIQPPIAIDDITINAVPIPEYGFSLTQITPDQIVLGGESAIYEIRIDNYGYEDDTYTLSYQSAEDWQYILDPENEVFVTAGSSAIVTLEVFVPTTVESGDTDTVNFYATSQNDDALIEGLSITTTALVLLIPPYLQDFSTLPFPPEFWKRYTGLLSENTTMTSTSTGWLRSINFANTPGHPNGNGTKLNIYGTTRRHWLVTPPIDLGIEHNYQLEFHLALTAYNSSNPPMSNGVDDRFAVVISTDGGVTWSSDNILALWDNAGSGNVFNNISPNGELVILSLNEYEGMISVGFYGESTLSNADNDLHVDNIKIREPVSYEYSLVKLTNDLTIPAGDSAIYQARIINTGNDTDTYQISIPPGYNWTYIYDDTDRIVPAGQSAIINIEVIVDQDAFLGQTDQISLFVTSWGAPQLVEETTFTTVAYAPLPLPYQEDFTGIATGELPPFWTRTHPNWGVAQYAYAGGLSPEMRFHNDPDTNALHRLVTPPIHIYDSGEAAYLQFKQFADHFTDGYTLRVQVSIDEIDWDDVWTLEPQANIGPETVSIALDQYIGETVFISWVMEGQVSNINAWYIDDLVLYREVEVLPTPQVSIEIVISELTRQPDQVLLSWDAVENAVWYLIYSTDDPYNGIWEHISTVETTFYQEDVSDNRFFRVVASTSFIEPPMMERATGRTGERARN